MRLVLHSLQTSTIPNLRTWLPEDPDAFCAIVAAQIGRGSKRQGTDVFTVMVATPKGLMAREAEGGVLFAGPIVVLASYDYDVLWKWMEDRVEACTAETWEASVERLQKWFRWEYDYALVPRPKRG